MFVESAAAWSWAFRLSCVPCSSGNEFTVPISAPAASATTRPAPRSERACRRLAPGRAAAGPSAWSAGRSGLSPSASASPSLSPIRALALGLLAAALYLVCAQLAFNSGRIVPVLAKLLAQSSGGTGRGLISICAAGGQGVTAILERA